MKKIEVPYQEATVEFFVDRENKIKVNASEIANLFNKNVKDFINLKSTKDYIDVYSTGGDSKIKRTDILDTKSKSAILMDAILALRFALWLDTSFEIWLHKTIEEIKFEHYNAHFKALTAEQEEKVHFDKLCRQAVYEQNELALQIIESHRALERFKYDKVNALRRNSRQVNSRTLFNQEDN